MNWGPIWMPQIILSELTKNSQKSRVINNCFIINHFICQFVTLIPAHLGHDVVLIFNFSNIATWMAAGFACLSMVILSYVPPDHRAVMLITVRPKEVSDKCCSPVAWCSHEHETSWGAVLWNTAVEHIRAPAKQVQGCLHPSGEMYFFSTA